MRLLNGAKGWRNGQETSGVSYEAMVLQAARLDLPWLLLKYKTKLVDNGPVERDGRPPSQFRRADIPVARSRTVLCAEICGLHPEEG